MDAAKAEAKKQGKPVEIPSLHTESMTTIANPDGKTVGTYVYQSPVRFKNGSGTWQAIDTTLIRDGATVRPKAIKDEVRLSAGGDTNLLRVKTADGSAQVVAAAKLPIPTLSGNSATYADAYGAGIDLMLQVTAVGVRQKIVIRQRPAEAVTFRVPVDPGAGLKYRTKSGLAQVLDDGKKVADITPAMMLDATATESIATGKLSSVDTTLDGADLVYKPDAEFLANPATTYPVTLLANPTPWYGAGYPSDTFVSNDSRFSVGGAQQYMDAIYAGRYNYDGESSSYYIYRSYLKYDLSNAPWYGRPILNADIRPWNYITTHCGGDEQTPKMVVRRITSDWALNATSSVNLRWDRQPSTTTTGQAVKGGGVGRIRKAGGTYVNCSQPSQELYYSIEDIVRAWAGGATNYGLQISANADTGGTSNFREYLSSEWAGIDGRGPVLFVEYDAPAEDLTVIREYPGDQPLPEASYEDDKQWAKENLHDGEELPGRSINPVT
ncbi:DNRLRE domain-containing protein [Nonomuraea sp. NPDC049028]|uniref:DNRLRE domain-containing protein n=1 Tax=Nonomuraea sp. NPDC049028 TaxID=3364348 RepID=UPI003723ABFC